MNKIKSRRIQQIYKIPESLVTILSNDDDDDIKKNWRVKHKMRVCLWGLQTNNNFCKFHLTKVWTSRTYSTSVLACLNIWIEGSNPGLNTDVYPQLLAFHFSAYVESYNEAIPPSLSPAPYYITKIIVIVKSELEQAQRLYSRNLKTNM